MSVNQKMPGSTVGPRSIGKMDKAERISMLQEQMGMPNKRGYGIGLVEKKEEENFYFSLNCWNTIFAKIDLKCKHHIINIFNSTEDIFIHKTHNIYLIFECQCIGVFH